MILFRGAARLRRQCLLTRHQLIGRIGKLPGRYIAVTNGGKKFVCLFVFETRGDFFRGQLCNGHTVHFPVENGAPGTDVVLKILMPEPGTHTRPGARCFQIPQVSVQPVPAWLTLAGRQYFYVLTICNA